MKKFLMLLSGLVMVGAAVLGYQNKNTLAEKTSALEKLKTEVVALNNKLNEAEQKKTDTETKETQAKDTRNQAAAAVEDVKRKLLVVERDLETANAEMKKAEIEQKEIDLTIKNAFPDGQIKSVDDLQATLTTLKEKLTEHQSKKTELNSKLEEAIKVKQVQVTKVREEEKKQYERAQRLALNSLVATVIASNKEWGFVMVNAGRAHGVSPDASLLVKRGNSHIARLRIVSVEDNVTVGDVVRESLAKGIDVQPGDKVIFENIQ